jgi:hypothetical protein
LSFAEFWIRAIFRAKNKHVCSWLLMSALLVAGIPFIAGCGSVKMNSAVASATYVVQVTLADASDESMAHTKHHRRHSMRDVHCNRSRAILAA